MVTWHIKKSGEDRYSVSSQNLEEDVNGSQLMGMLNAKGLASTQINEILQSLDTKDVGYQTTVTFRQTV
jgi:hypothetical protein